MDLEVFNVIQDGDGSHMCVCVRFRTLCNMCVYVPVCVCVCVCVCALVYCVYCYPCGVQQTLQHQDCLVVSENLGVSARLESETG